MFTYNRPFHTRRVIESLVNNRLAEQSELVIYSDGPADDSVMEEVEAVRAYLREIRGFSEINIIKRENNFGLADSIISGVTLVLDQYPRVIVVEDDLELSPDFLSYMNAALDRYEDDTGVFSIAGYSYPVKVPEDYPFDTYLFPRCASWGWATWKDRWKKVDWDVSDYDELAGSKEDIDLFNRGGDDLFDMLTQQVKEGLESWAIRWCYTHFRNNALCLYPVRPLSRNAGFDSTGVHSHSTPKFEVNLQPALEGEIRFCSSDELNADIVRNIRVFLKTRDAFFRSRVLYFLWDKFIRRFMS